MLISKFRFSLGKVTVSTVVQVLGSVSLLDCDRTVRSGLLRAELSGKEVCEKQGHGFPLSPSPLLSHIVYLLGDMSRKLKGVI